MLSNHIASKTPANNAVGVRLDSVIAVAFNDPSMRLNVDKLIEV